MRIDFVGLIFKVDARKGEGKGRSRIFAGKKGRNVRLDTQEIFVKIEFVFLFFAVMEVNGKEFVEFLPPPINSISNVFSNEERKKKIESINNRILIPIFLKNRFELN